MCLLGQVIHLCHGQVLQDSYHILLGQVIHLCHGQVLQDSYHILLGQVIHLCHGHVLLLLLDIAVLFHLGRLNKLQGKALSQSVKL